MKFFEKIHEIKFLNIQMELERSLNLCVALLV